MMDKKELIYQLRNAPLDGGDPIHWVHLICEAAEMLEWDDTRSCEGCAYWPGHPWHEQCAGCARMYEDNYQNSATKEKIMTNSERIRHMDDHELGAFLCHMMTADCCDTTCPARNICKMGDNGMEKWISMESREEDYTG